MIMTVVINYAVTQRLLMCYLCSNRSTFRTIALNDPDQSDWGVVLNFTFVCDDYANFFCVLGLNKFYELTVRNNNNQYNSFLLYSQYILYKSTIKFQSIDIISSNISNERAL